VSDNKKQYETTNVIVRWGAWSPFLNNKIDNDGIYEINMHGGSHISNPEKTLVYKIPDTKMQDEISTKSAPGKIIFQFKRGNQVSKVVVT
jgi:hypothetical protein